MTNSDRIISELINALDNIKREAEKPEASRHYIAGAAEYAMANCARQQERNHDGYFVVRAIPPYAVRKQLREATLAVGRKQ